MNLTYTQLLAGIKYPYSAKEAMSGKRKKAGFFVTESENAGTCTELFPEGSEEHRILRSLKRLARKELFRNEEVENLELAGFSIISGLLEHYGKLLELTRENFLFLVNEDWQGKQLDVEWRLYNRLPRKHLHLYKHVCGTKVNGALSKRQEWCMRAHLITDYISGMTDRFALSTFQRLGGMRIA